MAERSARKPRPDPLVAALARYVRECHQREIEATEARDRRRAKMTVVDGAKRGGGAAA